MKKCLLCEKTMDIEFKVKELFKLSSIEIDEICIACQKTFVKLSDCATCKICGRRWPSSSICQDCYRWNDLSDFKNTALFEYNFAMREYMRRYKFLGDYRLRKVFQKDLLASISKPEMVVPIPVNKSTLLTRGFNQVTGLLGKLSYREILLTKQANKSISQSKKSRKERMKLEQPFLIDLKEISNISLNQNIVLVDDVYTTGTTIRLAAELLMDYGFKNVRGLTLAR